MHPARRLDGLVLATLLGLALTACAPIHVRSFAERGADFSRYRTYNWASTDRLSTGDPRLDNNPFFLARLQGAVDAQMARRGFEKTTASTPDLVIHYHASITQQMNTVDMDPMYGACDDCKPFVFDAGTLLLDFVDGRTNQLVWRGWAESSMDGVIDNQEWMNKRIDQAVSRILAELPHTL